MDVTINATGHIKLRGARSGRTPHYTSDGIAAAFGGVKPDSVGEYFRGGRYVENTLFTSRIASAGLQKFSNYRGVMHLEASGSGDTDPVVPDGVNYEVLRIDVGATQLDGVTAFGASRYGTAAFGAVTALNIPSALHNYKVEAIYSLGPADTGLQSANQADFTWNVVIQSWFGNPTDPKPTKIEVSTDGTTWIDVTALLNAKYTSRAGSGGGFLHIYHFHYGLDGSFSKTPNPAYNPASTTSGTQQYLINNPSDPKWHRGSWLYSYISGGAGTHFYMRIT